jgi:hypothetical protein
MATSLSSVCLTSRPPRSSTAFPVWNTSATVSTVIVGRDSQMNADHAQKHAELADRRPIWPYPFAYGVVDPVGRRRNLAYANDT